VPPFALERKKERICSSKPFAAQKQNFSAGWVHGSDFDLFKFSFAAPLNDIKTMLPTIFNQPNKIFCLA
jgi:hypothetical protein